MPLQILVTATPLSFGNNQLHIVANMQLAHHISPCTTREYGVKTTAQILLKIGTVYFRMAEEDQPLIQASGLTSYTIDIPVGGRLDLIYCRIYGLQS